MQAGRNRKKTGSSPPEQGCCPEFPETVHTGGRTYHSGYLIREVHHIGHEAGTDIQRNQLIRSDPVADNVRSLRTIASPSFRFFSPSGVRTAAWPLMM